ncbi:MAG TPA: cupin domain-containing protein [Candidatus Limnocylindrales bacterium]|nr:cupin domain-containing protein [Candidatus Limnocylindrales bacterium]
MTTYVFHARDAIRYRFPTHTNDLLMDRADAATSEAFFVILEPGEAPPFHVHPDAEQVFYVLEGTAEMTVREAGGPATVALAPGDFVRTPPGLYHAVRNTGTRRFTYLSIDCFTGAPTAGEPTWDDHVRAMCELNGWDFDAVKLGTVTDGSGALDSENAGA